MAYDPNTSEYNAEAEAEYNRKRTREIFLAVGLSMLKSQWPKYLYSGTTPTLHPVLGLLKPGSNAIDPKHEAAAEACVKSGLLRRE